MPTISFAPRPEPLEFDEDILTRFCVEHGADAERHLAALLQEVEDGLALAASQVRLKAHGGLGRTATDLAALARGIGLLTLERAAMAVLGATRSGDEVAFAACAARLVALSRPETFGNWKMHGGTRA